MSINTAVKTSASQRLDFVGACCLPAQNVRLADGVGPARLRLQRWAETRRFTGHDPYDLLNSPFLSAGWTNSSILKAAVIQFGRRVAGLGIRRWLRVPASRNPKALALFLAGYCDLCRMGEDHSERVRDLTIMLKDLRSPREPSYCWGYDWDFISLRGTVLKKFSPNSIATCCCAEALLDAAELTGDQEAAYMADSAARFVLERLNRSIETKEHLCFSYTPQDRTRIFNSSALAGAFLARIGSRQQNRVYLELARRSMKYLADRCRPDGSWPYGEGRWQAWIDGFHTGYNLCALLQYVQSTADRTFDESLECGYRFYKRYLVDASGVPKYFPDRAYPIDIHCCSQAILTFCMFADRDPDALALANKVASWTISNMQRLDGAFYYQRHRYFTNPTPYMRWGQAWMFRALTRLELTHHRSECVTSTQ